eukprot:TRINITY_DN2362_c0_g1_i2.p1 TRINITY_DN2362_c0_g1~~TRINITY_DN2362_c0_g1_i2.p1  ORF type:complete len:132 (-),score=15.45 TRINITY_DN2362_c0_g1_i2:135-530(-)
MGSWWASIKEDDDDKSRIDFGDKEALRPKVLDFFQNQSLSDHLKDSEGWNAFHEFLESEYCGENTRFWLAVHNLQQASDSNMAAKASEIYEAHFGSSAPYEINLPTTLLKQLKQLVDSKNYSKDMFNEAQV